MDLQQLQRHLVNTPWGPSLLLYLVSDVTELKPKATNNGVSAQYKETGLEECGEIELIFINVFIFDNLFL